jgi:rubrerythrin
MAEGERATGTPNTIYDLSSVLFHALEGGASYDQFIQDAEREGDQELVEFFRMVRDEDSNRADRAQELLAERTTIGGVGMGGAAMPMEEAPRMRGEHPLGTEGAPLSEEEERARRPEGEREEDKGLIDRAIDRLSGEREQRRDR